MWIEKLSNGVLRVLTPLGPRYIKPSFSRRIYLLWIFRHFGTLPLQVLSARQRKLIDDMCVEQHFVALSPTDAWEDAPILGTIERRPPVEMEAFPPRRPSASVEHIGRLAADVRQRP